MCLLEMIWENIEVVGDDTGLSGGGGDDREFLGKKSECEGGNTES